MDLDKYIKVYDNALDVNLCRNILHASKNVEMKRWDRGGRPQFNEFNITDHAENKDHPDDIWNTIHNQVIQAVKDVSNRYM